MAKKEVIQLNVNASEDLIGRIERYVYENKGKSKVTKTSVVIDSVEKFLKAKGY